MIKTISKLSKITLKNHFLFSNQLPSSVSKTGNNISLIIQAKPKHPKTTILTVNDN